ncbi:hypothetical protein HNP38_000549 [Chryseobacterium defluvii]|uniref:Uncharacterized protein n=1 Tax=Chryseobacterium defluvii TaxID=160396 RepID=A0A840KBA2_9FLAO|nr:hypothetical protein [Chryseobacterium defluvii]
MSQLLNNKQHNQYIINKFTKQGIIFANVFTKFTHFKNSRFLTDYRKPNLNYNILFSKNPQRKGCGFFINL